MKAVNLVDKERGPPAAPEILLGALNHFFHLFFAGRRRIQAAKIRLRLAGDDLRDRGLPAAGRAVEYHGADGIRLDRPVEQLILAENVRLPRNFFETLRSHSDGERRFLSKRILPHVIKEIHQFSRSLCRRLKSR